MLRTLGSVGYQVSLGLCQPATTLAVLPLISLKLPITIEGNRKH